ncbi:MAG: DUF3048 domain-containing protein [Chloroflexi bacterium]|nr:DUF3048 domain-containing protein [Chloroflexota bacterium]
MRRWRALVLGLAGLTAACAAPPALPTSAPQPPATTPAPVVKPTTGAAPLATVRPTDAPRAPVLTPTAPTTTPTPVVASEVGLDIRLWNGDAEVQLDGRTIEPGHLEVPRGRHQLAALVDGEIAALADTPPDGGPIDLVVPPPHAGLAIMIENQADARPQTGLTAADVVYEAAYTDTAADRGFLRQLGRQQNRQWGPLLFDAQAPHGDEVAEHITLGFLPWPYRVGYAWDTTDRRYLRSMEGLPHLDAVTGAQIAPATIVVQFAEVEAIPDDPKLRLDVNLVGGSGELVVFSGGTRRAGTWRKSTPRSASIWLDSQGEPMVIPPGPVWVEVLPVGSPLVSG